MDATGLFMLRLWVMYAHFSLKTQPHTCGVAEEATTEGFVNRLQRVVNFQTCGAWDASAGSERVVLHEAQFEHITTAAHAALCTKLERSCNSGAAAAAGHIMR